MTLRVRGHWLSVSFQANNGHVDKASEIVRRKIASLLSKLIVCHHYCARKLERKQKIGKDEGKKGREEERSEMMGKL